MILDKKKNNGKVFSICAKKDEAFFFTINEIKMIMKKEKKHPLVNYVRFLSFF